MASVLSQSLPGRRESAAAPRRDREMARALRAMLFMVAAAIGAVLLVAPLVSSRLVAFSPLWFYGLLIVLLAAGGIAIDRSGRERGATLLLYFLAFDMLLGFATKGLSRIGFSADLLPVMDYRMLGAKGFGFHPLLQMAPTPGYADARYAHTPQGTRAVRPPPGEAAGGQLPGIALIGGSSTYDISVAQGDSWPDRLQGKLPERRVWNFGVPGYTTVEHIIQTAWYVPEVGTDCNVYYIGWNDIRNNNQPSLDAAYANYHLLDRGNHERVANSATPLATLRLLKLLVASVEVYPTRPSLWASVSPQRNFDPRFEELFRRNLETIIGINRQRGTRIAFIGQLLNDSALRAQPPGRRDFAAPAIEDRFVPEVMDHFNSVTADVAGRHRVPYLQPSQRWLEPSDFTDFGHFTPLGAEKFATRVHPFIRSACGAP